MKSFSTHFRNRGNIAIFTAAFIVLALFLITTLFEASLANVSVSSSWDVRRQLDIEARAIAYATKESILAVAETSPTNSPTSLSSNIASRIAAISTGSPSITISSNASNGSVSLPANPQWPSSTPATTTRYSSAPTNSFTIDPRIGIGLDIQKLIHAGPFATLGTLSLAFSRSNSFAPSDSTNYTVLVKLFSVPLGNYNWIPYGLPSRSNGVISGLPPVPGFARPTGPVPTTAGFGFGFTAPVVTAYGGEVGTFPEMFEGTGSTLPYYYRDLVSLTWNAFEYWTSLTYQNSLLTAAGATNTFDFTSPSNLPSGVTWDGTSATLDLSTTTASLIVFVDSLGAGRIKLVGAAAIGTPVVVAVRNFSTVQTTLEITSSNSRSVLLYAPNTNVTATSAGLSTRGGVLLFPDSSVGTGFTMFGLVAYPQFFSAAPAITGAFDTQAQDDLKDITPRVLLVSARASVQQ